MTQKRIFTLDTCAGDHISDTTQKMVQILINRPKLDGVRVHFNGIWIQADKNSTAKQLEAEFKRKMKAQSRKYRRSPKAKKRQREQNQELKRQKELALVLLRQFKVLDKTDLSAVIAWLERFQFVSDRRGVLRTGQAYEIVRDLRKAGYFANENVIPHYLPEDKVNSGRYIVGQGMDQLERHFAIHPVVMRFAKKWQAKFEDTAA